jgi:hypothetical protein
MQRVASIRQPQMGSQRDGLATIPSALKRFGVRLFGCWHHNMSRPITRKGQTTRACVKCGVRRSFDTESWKTFGSFYRRD